MVYASSINEYMRFYKWLGAELKPKDIMVYTKIPSYVTIPQNFYSSSGIGLLFKVAFISKAKYIHSVPRNSTTALYSDIGYAGKANLIKDSVKFAYAR